MRPVSRRGSARQQVFQLESRPLGRVGMRRLMLLVALVAAIPLASWASSTVDLDRFHSESRHSNFISTPSSGSSYSNIQGIDRSKFAEARHGNLALNPARFNASFQSGARLEEESISLD